MADLAQSLVDLAFRPLELFLDLVGRLIEGGRRIVIGPQPEALGDTRPEALDQQVGLLHEL